MNPDALFGAWTLQSAQFEFEDGADAIEIYGPDPTGRIIFSPDFRMVALITASGRGPPEPPTETAGLFSSMMGYSGAYRFSGPSTIVTRVDIAWHPAWVGTEQVRHVALDGDRLALWSNPQTHPAYDNRIGVGRLVWVRTSPPAPGEHT